MKVITAALLTLSSLVVVNGVPGVHAQESGSFTGIVQRVWEDGFLLDAGDRNLRVDTWDLCRDFTANHIGVGDRVTVTGEFDGGEFDAFSITNPNGARVCRRRN